MKKLLFLDYRELEYVEGFGRTVESPVKDAGAPLLRPELPWERGNMQMFGSVLRGADGRFRAWYEVVEAPWRVRLAYAESDDGLRLAEAGTGRVPGRWAGDQYRVRRGAAGVGGDRGPGGSPAGRTGSSC